MTRKHQIVMLFAFLEILHSSALPSKSKLDVMLMNVSCEGTLEQVTT